ncbi:zinc-binding dehydrogenase [Bifidobacterium choloepi]|uniref:Zinc-binding dehydrogenase n=1 Tax=Bifidobacterium choloepi TaxID=2614131 RepID=A0A6I5N1C3_9BIFI|nr:zinc-binding dehydrogenase [Bifidobacterium choloepi]NEG69439.1 zinc-binding dehydrogenase [Bifidobacterium choloepi]
MKAVFASSIDYHNPLAALTVGERPDPEPRADWSVIRTSAVSVNHHDIWSLKGVGLTMESTPMILGTDICGVLEETPLGADGKPVKCGATVHGGGTVLKAGDEVVAYTVVGGPDGGAGTLPGQRRTILSEQYPGTMAQRCAVPTANLFPKPKNLDVLEAAVLGTSWLTAYSMLFSRARVKPGDTVLVQGCGGGVATAAIQMAHAAGLEVFATSRSETRRDRALALGADVAVASGERLPHKVDAVIDSVGSATWSHSVKSVRPGGTIVVCGATAGDQPGAELTRIFFQDIRVQGNTMGSRDDFASMLRFVEHNDLHPVVDSTYPVDRAPEAFAKLIEGRVFGKTVLQF